ncbi:MAG: hypothetical protein U1G08_05310 [Verrucomicrobiota bacterium]
MVLIRHRTSQRPEAGGRELIECPGYRIQALITSLPQSVDGLRVWRRYNGRADCENIIKELANAYALPQLCLKRFYATEAALSLSVLAYNLCVPLPAPRRMGGSGHHGHPADATLHHRRDCQPHRGLSDPPSGRAGRTLRAWWQRLFEKLSCSWPNCIAVEPIPINPTH